MSNICKLPSYSKEVSLDFLKDVILNSTLENVSENVASLLKKQASFATSLEESDENFEEIIQEELIPDIITTISKFWKSALMPTTVEKLTEELSSIFIKKESETPEEEVPQTKTSEDKKTPNKKTLSLRQMRNFLFKGENVLSDFHLNNFKLQIKNVIIFNTNANQRSLVFNKKSLNENIKNYKQSLYETIYDFCILNNIPVKNIRSYYGKSYDVRGENVLESFYNYLESLPTNERQELLESAWEKEILKQQNPKTPSLLNAACSYFSLVYFDKLLESVVGKYISSASGLDEPISIVEANGRKTIKYKYTFGKKNSNFLKNFGDLMQNALDTMGNFSKFLIELIPNINNSSTNITQIQYLNSLLHLKETIYKLAPVDKNINNFKQYISLLHQNPKESWKKILDNFVKINDYSEFIQEGLTYEDISILKSIHRFMYGKTAEEKKNSLYSLEKLVHGEDGYKEVYSLIDTLLGTIDSISDISYLQVSYNYSTGLSEVSIKKKYFNNKLKFDLILGINLESSKPLSTNIKEQYHIKYLNGPFSFTVGNKTIKIKPKIITEWGIFHIDTSLLEVTINDIPVDKYFKDINLNGSSNRRDILHSDSGINKEFLDLLEFIDGALTTGFSLNGEGLQKFHIYNIQHKKGSGIKDLILAASKVYVTRDIYKNFLESIDKKEINPETQQVYTLFDLKTWIKNNKSLVPIQQFYAPENKDNKKLFVQRLGVTYFNPIRIEEEWIDNLGDASAIITGESLKATTKDFNKHSIPNYSPAFLGAEILEVLARDSEHSVTKNLLFSTKSNAIGHVVIDTDVRMVNGKHKAVADMSEAELQYHFFINKFVLPFSNGIFYSLPTVYSDKKKFINYEINLFALGFKKGEIPSNEWFIDNIMKTTGKYYKDIFDNILTDYSKLFDIEPTIEGILNELKKYNLETLLKKVEEYNETHSDKIELDLDLHYREVNGKLGLNETLLYYDLVLYSNKEILTNTLKRETFNYVNSLLNSGVVFDTKNGFLELLEYLANAMNINLSDWIEDDILVLAKNDDYKIIAGENIEYSDNLEINPLLEKFVLMHNLINNNLKENLIGTEGIHKIKIKTPEISIEDKKFLGFDPLEKVDLIDLYISTENKLKAKRLKKDSIIRLNDIRINLLNQIRTLLSASENAQLKRTVAVPGTMRYYLLKTLTGIAPTLRGAIILDVRASVFNPEGDIKNNLEAHDGGAYLCPLTAILQNNSLQDSEVGDVIKPLWQVNVPKYGSKRLVKFAAHTLTNAMMRNSQMAEISALHMFKKMTNISWNGEYNTKEHNLLNMYSHRENNPNVKFSDISHVSGDMFYTLGNNTFQIVNFGWDEKGYYTKEQEVIVNVSNKRVTLKDKTKPIKYYLYFDDLGNQYKIKEGEVIPENLHTIDSLYELFLAFGGSESQSFSNGQFVYSNGSLLATTAIINMVSEPTEKYYTYQERGLDVEETLDFYYQPLKYKMIDYLLNQTSIKNGSANINFVSAYQNPDNELNNVLDDSPLRYIEMETLRYGIQQDSEHDADDEELTEMTLVISSIDAGGYYHDEVNELYKAIGTLALEAAKVELRTIKLFSENLDNLNVLYDLIGRVLIENISYRRGSSGLAENLIDRIKSKFSLISDHSIDLIKIPFSDLTIYAQILSTIGSILNKKSVKRKFPGTGQVMVPGYNIVLIWDIDGIPSKYEDVVKEAKNLGITSNKQNSIEYNKDIVKQYLTIKQKEYAESNTKVIPLKLDGTTYDSEFWENQLQNINPIDIVLISVNGKALSPIKLDKIEDYYLFKSDLLQFVKNRFGINDNITELSVVKRIDIPRNLAPTKINFKYEKDGISYSKNVYDIWAVKAMFFEYEEYKQKILLDLTLSKLQKSELLENKKIELRDIEQRVLGKLEDGFFEDEDGKEYKITELNNSPAETIMSNIYKGKFELKEGESLYDILKQGPKRFEVNPLKFLPKENTFDLAFMKTNGNGILISFNDNELKSIKGQYNVKRNDFKKINKHYVIKLGDKYIDRFDEKEVPNKTLDGKSIDSYIYLLDDDNNEVALIGIDIDVSDSIEFDGKNFVDKESKKIVKGDFAIKDNKVIKTELFVDRKNVKPKFYNKYTVYNINKNKIEQLLGESYVNTIIGQLYNLDSYTYIMPPRYINPNNLSTIKNSLKFLRALSTNSDVRNYLNKLLAGLNFFSKNYRPGTLITLNNYSTYFKEYNKILAEKRFNSFKESLKFISSRIPAQSLQSFMQMRVVGFTESNANIAFVTHWLTWLQGSDYTLK